MEQFWTGNDINEFLQTHQILAKNKRERFEYNGHGDIEIDAYVRDQSDFVIKKIFLDISEIGFIIYEKNPVGFFQEEDGSETLLHNFSIDWLMFLLERYPEKEEELKKFISEKIDQVHEESAMYIKLYQDKIDKFVKNENDSVDYLNGLMKVIEQNNQVENEKK